VAIASMTGYARAQGAGDGMTWVWEARSVNGRNLESRCRVPPGWDRIDNAARAAVAGVLKRGSVSVTLTVAQEQRESALRINRAVLDQLLPLMAELQRAGAAPPAADGLLRIRGVIEDDHDNGESAGDSTALDAAVIRTLGEALQGLCASRAAEGVKLAQVLAGHVDEITTLRDRAAGRAAAQGEVVRARFEQQLADVLTRIPALPEERLAQEVALLVGKADVREELDRLAAHLQQARELLADGAPGNPVGRKFDFLCQEFNREANTLCSKSADIELTRIGLDLKSAIERMREQVQNVE
jgi:uncharacterized protein (TIGR00255 family)